MTKTLAMQGFVPTKTLVRSLLRPGERAPEPLGPDQRHCECGCGLAIDLYDKHGRGPRRFFMGHQGRGIKDTRRKSKKIYMSLARARSIAGALGQARKMPGWTYGLDAFACHKGSELAEDPKSTCYECFARRDLYLWKGVREAHEFRMEAIKHPEWCEAMVELISHHCADEPWFRWHDSGDIMSVDHLARICRVAGETPDVNHWLPTREYGFVAEYVKSGGVIPPNLTIRFSAYYVGKKAKLPKVLKGMPTSTVHEEHGEPLRFPVRKESIECLAYTRGNRCGSCRACWSPKVKNISYPIH